MCGIVGYFSGVEDHKLQGYLQGAVGCLNKRGPDAHNVIEVSPKVGLAHARLSIIDTNAVANQPMTDPDGRFTMVFNGEIFNYRELRAQFLSNETFFSTSDTEVLLYLYKRLGAAALQHLNGFFAFAVYDHQTGEVFLARDRYGIKPLHIFEGDNLILFGSEMKALLQFPLKREIDFATLALYFQLNYVPGNSAMLKGFRKVPPGHYAQISSDGKLQVNQWYTIPFTPGERLSAPSSGYTDATRHLRMLVEEAVERRLVSDVPLGAFLSGGIDSSIVTYCAAKRVKGLNTFSIGYKDEPYFDETKYANLVAAKFKTNHTVYAVTNEEMFARIFDVLDYIDEPFADSSSIAVNILCHYTRQKVTVALSGDGGDELFAGYNKHQAAFRAQQINTLNVVMKAALPLLNVLPQSRHSRIGNLFRQAQRYSRGLHLTKAQRYWNWCTLTSEEDVLQMFGTKIALPADELQRRKAAIFAMITEEGDLNDLLLADMHMVLPDDMLTKVDLMSMANSLEVRVPLLDYTVVNYAFSLPVSYKIEAGNGKKILKDAFRTELPEELFNRPKHGFEVPLLKWMRTGLRSLIEEELLERNFIEEQGIFDAEQIDQLKRKLFSNNPGDVHATLWALLVFQYWYKKYIV